MPSLGARDFNVLHDISQQEVDKFDQARLEAWISEIPSRYRAFETEDILKGWGGRLTNGNLALVKGIINDTNHGFAIMQGPSGTGKTTLAVTMSRELLINHKKTVRVVNAPSMFAEFSYSNDRDLYLARYSDCDVLVLDDLGVVNEGISPHQQRYLWSLVENRWSNADKTTIITTNMSIQDNTGAGIRTLVGESTWDRISDSATFIQIKGESFRNADED